MNSKAKVAVVIFFGLISGVAVAAKCELKINRTACPGQEEISYKKCNGQKSCSEVVDVADVAQCKSAAIKACENQRLQITKSKEIAAAFDGAALKTDVGSADFCTAYEKRAAEFDKCDK